MRVRIEPPITDWPTPTAERPIVTGHQQTLFHPGILAKYIACDVVAEWAEAELDTEADGLFKHVVVDQDVYNPLMIDFPIVDGDRLKIRRVHLGHVHPDIPVANQPAVGTGAFELKLEGVPWAEDAAIQRRSFSSWFDTSQAADRTLAGQAAFAMENLMAEAHIETPDALWASELLRDDEYRWVLDRLLHDAKACVAHYNRAVAAHPAAGIRPLGIDPFMIEVPLWELRWMRPRRRVFVDVADREPRLVAEDGEPIESLENLAPRALLMTALLRDPDRCSMFVHGTGGWSYDRVTEQWWRDWQGVELAPMAVVTADLYLDFDAPVNDAAALRHAVWRRHHVKDNIDRELEAAGRLDTVDTDTRVLISRKRELIDHMHDDRDKARRRAAFDEVHRINAALRAAQPEVIEAADAALRRARVGVENRAVAGRRDWFFGLYPRHQLDALRDAISKAFLASPRA